MIFLGNILESKQDHHENYSSDGKWKHREAAAGLPGTEQDWNAEMQSPQGPGSSVQPGALFTGSSFLAILPFLFALKNGFSHLFHYILSSKDLATIAYLILHAPANSTTNACATKSHSKSLCCHISNLRMPICKLVLVEYGFWQAGIRCYFETRDTLSNHKSVLVLCWHGIRMWTEVVFTLQMK